MLRWGFWNIILGGKYVPQDPPHKVGIPTLKIDVKPTLKVAIFRVGIHTFGL